MSDVGIPQGFPTANHPLVDSSGHITRPWLALQTTLWKGRQGGSSSSAGLIAYSKNPFIGGTITLDGSFQYLELALKTSAVIHPPPNPDNLQVLLIKDMKGNLSETLTAKFTGKIDGQANRVLNGPYGWFYIFYSSTAKAWGQF